ncbi:MAG: N-acetylmuramoyl-L-alanine amidase [Anaerolineae bacterium]|nr:N-acetylmuramoyl-L-alanine amidase [Anaerolineae bacterium]MDQ7034784.1 N-acetylmuramoyl-L-alanine amidase [Anaerolineae bacterium]
MPDDKRPEETDDEEQPNVSPSALFLEMMREAARHADKPVPLEPMPPEEIEVLIPESPEFPEFNEESIPYEPMLLEEDYLDSQENGDEPNIAPEFEAQIPVSQTDDDPIPHEFDIPTDAPNQDVEIRAQRPIYTPPATEDTIAPDDREALLEAQRIRRIRRRRERTRRRRVGIVGGFLRTVFIAIFSAALASTIFTWFTAPEFITPRVASDLQVADATSIAAAAPLNPTNIPITPNFMQRIGIVTGHRGPENDPGAVCADGLTEAEINFSVSQIVVRDLRTRGFTVDLLDEFDPRLRGFQGAALVSLHSNDCTDYGEGVATGYMVARAAARPSGGFDDVLAECIALYYGRSTQKERLFTLTLDMTDYHSFREIHATTPAVIVELGFLRNDRELLTQRQDLIAEGIINGILCFFNGENPIPALTATPSVGG